MTNARPFPYASLEALTRADVVAAARLRHVARDVVRLEGVASALGEIVDDRVEIRVRRIRPAEPPRGADDAIGVLLAPAAERSTARRLLVEVDGALGAALTAKALRQRAPKITDASRIATPQLAGAFAAVLAATLRRAHAGSTLKVIAAGPGAALARDLVGAATEVTTAWLTVVVGGEAFEARVSVPDAAGGSASAATFTHEDLLLLGDAPLALPLVITTTLATREELAALALGDAFVPTNLRLAPDGSGALLGAIALVPPRGERGLAADLAAGGQLVVRGLLESHPWEQAMSSDDRSSDVTTVDVLEDAPVVVRVELGTVEMTARDWAALGTGDVVAIGRKIGDGAVLRVGGVEIARGELVMLEGEMAVRITGRTRSRGANG